MPVSHWKTLQLARVLRAGGVIAYPTEAVWGLGCAPWSEAAVLRLLELKDRPMAKGLILVAAAIEQFDFLLDDLPQRWQDRLSSTWPGPSSGTWRASSASTSPGTASSRSATWRGAPAAPPGTW